jgi:hypothetical protein
MVDTAKHLEPTDWLTGDELMTSAQASYLKALCEEMGEEFNPELSKTEASYRIEELQRKLERSRKH